MSAPVVAITSSATTSATRRVGPSDSVVPNTAASFTTGWLRSSISTVKCQRQSGKRNVALPELDVAATDAARLHLDKHLVGRDLRDGDIEDLQW